MAYRFFTIPIKDEGNATKELNHFLTAHRIVSEKMELAHDGTNSLWVVGWVERSETHQWSKHSKAYKKTNTMLKLSKFLKISI